MAVSKVVEISALQGASRRIALIAASAFFLATIQAQAQQAQISQDGRVIVTGEGDVAVAPDHAQITGGVTTRAKSVKEATDTNSKVASSKRISRPCDFQFSRFMRHRDQTLNPSFRDIASLIKSE